MISTALVGPRLLQGLSSTAIGEAWLPRVAEGEAILAVGHPTNAYTSDAHVADLLLLSKGSGVKA